MKNWIAQKEEKADLAQPDKNKMIKKPKISYDAIRKNTNLDKFLDKKAIEEDEEKIKV